MPEKFTGGIDAPQLRFGANEFVDDSNSLEALPAAAQNLANATNTLVLRSFNEKQQEAISKEDEYYERARRTKRGMVDSALAGDEKAELEFGRKLEDLKIAERQGAITGNNSQIRQDTLLKSYINRFPHLEENIRQQYSSTRARAQQEREQFNDPIEDGMDELVKRAVSNGRSVTRQLDFEHEKAELEQKKEMLTYRSMLGTSIENDMDIVFEKQGRHGAIMDVQDFISNTVNEADATGVEMDAGQLKANLRVRAELYKKDWRIYINDVVSRSENPGAVLSKSWVDGKMAEIDKIFDDQAQVLDSFDTLRVLKRTSEILQYKTLNEIAEISPLIGFFVKAAPDIAVDKVLREWDENKRIFMNGGMSALQIKKANSMDYDSEIIDFHLKLMAGYTKDGNAQKRDFDAVSRGASLVSTGVPALDAARANAITNTVLNSSEFDDDTKANAIKSAVQTEKQLSRPGEYFAPSRTFYTDPAKRRELQKNERAKTEMTQTLENDAPGIVQGIASADIPTLSFVPQLENEPGRDPWAAYQSGGPWSSSKISGPQLDKVGGTLMGSLGRMMPSGAQGQLDYMIAALNNDYWVYRTMHGPAAAETHVQEIMDLMNERTTEEAEAKAAAEEVPTVDTTD